MGLLVGSQLSAITTPKEAVAAAEQEIAQLRTMAAARGLALISKDTLLVELGQAIGRRMVKRTGGQIYQMLTCVLPYFPRELLQEILPKACVKEETPWVVHWELRTVGEVGDIVGPLLQKSGYICVGSTKAFRSKLERVIRVVAKLMPPFEITHEAASSGAERCYLNGMYVLATQDGELHYPKDNQRRELSITLEEQIALRRGVKADVAQMGREGQPLSPGWWRQLGDEEKARQVEEQLANPSWRGRKDRKTAAPRHRRVSQEMFEIAAIVEEKKSRGKTKVMYLVRWSGYDVTWEPWRINGQPGDPIETWEPALRLRGTAALQAWRTRTSQ